jgi:hypothetical protein
VDGAVDGGDLESPVPARGGTDEGAVRHRVPPGGHGRHPGRVLPAVAGDRGGRDHVRPAGHDRQRRGVRPATAIRSGRLITTILDPGQAPASDLAALYAQRWEFESTLDEINTHLGGPNLVLRSQHPDGAEQELYGFLLVHHAIRRLMHQAAQHGDHDPDRISFTRSLRVVRRQVIDQAAFSPRQTRPRRQGHPRRTA